MLTGRRTRGGEAPGRHDSPVGRRAALRLGLAAGLAGAAVTVPVVAQAQPREGNATADRPDAPECVADLVGR